MYEGLATVALIQADGNVPQCKQHTIVVVVVLGDYINITTVRSIFLWVSSCFYNAINSQEKQNLLK